MYRSLTLAALLAAFAGSAQEALWLREPAISPDGKTILFC
ncbi:MAG: PD40 domain-containing protein, partial [Flavobacteriales bacterium]|nr:PD40 domain-containing protein [Flavobacteriales bacterium]